VEWLNLLQRPFLTEGLKIKPIGFPRHKLPVLSAQRLSREGKDTGLHEKQPWPGSVALTFLSINCTLEMPFCFVFQFDSCGKNT
jgi:hypothetical protein